MSAINRRNRQSYMSSKSTGSTTTTSSSSRYGGRQRKQTGGGEIVPETVKNPNIPDRGADGEVPLLWEIQGYGEFDMHAKDRARGGDGVREFNTDGAGDTLKKQSALLVPSKSDQPLDVKRTGSDILQTDADNLTDNERDPDYRDPKTRVKNRKSIKERNKNTDLLQTHKHSDHRFDLTEAEKQGVRTFIVDANSVEERHGEIPAKNGQVWRSLELRATSKSAADPSKMYWTKRIIKPIPPKSSTTTTTKPGTGKRPKTGGGAAAKKTKGAAGTATPQKVADENVFSLGTLTTVDLSDGTGAGPDRTFTMYSLGDMTANEAGPSIAEVAENFNGEAADVVKWPHHGAISNSKIIKAMIMDGIITKDTLNVVSGDSMSMQLDKLQELMDMMNQGVDPTESDEERKGTAGIVFLIKKEKVESDEKYKGRVKSLEAKGARIASGIQTEVLSNGKIRVTELPYSDKQAPVVHIYDPAARRAGLDAQNLKNIDKLR